VTFQSHTNYLELFQILHVNCSRKPHQSGLYSLQCWGPAEFRPNPLKLGRLLSRCWYRTTALITIKLFVIRRIVCKLWRRRGLVPECKWLWQSIWWGPEWNLFSLFCFLFFCFLCSFGHQCKPPDFWLIQAVGLTTRQLQGGKPGRPELASKHSIQTRPVGRQITVACLSPDQNVVTSDLHKGSNLTGIRYTTLHP